MYQFINKTIVSILLLLLASCNQNSQQNSEMLSMLSSIAIEEADKDNDFEPAAKLDFYHKHLAQSTNFMDSISLELLIGNTLLQLGDEQKSIATFEHILRNQNFTNQAQITLVKKNLALAWVRQGEQLNCINSHGSESCVFPIKGTGVHQDKYASKQAITIYESILKEAPDDLEVRWLLNIAYMTIGDYPGKVPPNFLIKSLDSETTDLVKPFKDVAAFTGLDTKNMAGGSIIEDFNNDGYLDLVTSSWSLSEGMHFCKNNGDGSFTDLSEYSGLKRFTGGLNIMQTDYNNDGFKDIFVLRGAWKNEFGKEPNSLLKNNGDGTFTDVTKQSGLLSFYPTQTATWADFNNDGWLDVFIGNESSSTFDGNASELYISNRNGTFTELAGSAGVKINAFVKGVTSGDYNNDGLSDIFISTLDGKKILFKNESTKSGTVVFKDVSEQAGLTANRNRTFPTWFWDYDNDGWLDILICSYNFDKSMAWYAAAEALHQPTGSAGKVILFKNKHDGTFEDVSAQVGLDKIAFAMGSNFGDIDNDGYLDMYLGTGNPQYTSLVPNKMFKNIGGKSFVDVTNSARVGNLQKGHGVSFADLDNDGDQDVFIEMGGAYKGDAYQNSLYINPGQNNNHWINLSLSGVRSNKSAIGARIKVTFKENGVQRSVYRDVNSGGSFGSNPLMQHIGIGQATLVDKIEITWPGNRSPQVFKNIKPDISCSIIENNSSIKIIKKNKVDFTLNKLKGVICGEPTS